ncbi:hypothetical protein [Listeria booriae]|uniref:hypothetical protein n=1 Tax=Listeria booriae TaxID=1552123 RepID=UPI001623E7B9|nr:hypothetical protein [Listeria booriae]
MKYKGLLSLPMRPEPMLLQMALERWMSRRAEATVQIKGSENATGIFRKKVTAIDVSECKPGDSSGKRMILDHNDMSLLLNCLSEVTNERGRKIEA